MLTEMDAGGNGCRRKWMPTEMDADGTAQQKGRKKSGHKMTNNPHILRPPLLRPLFLNPFNACLSNTGSHSGSE